MQVTMRTKPLWDWLVGDGPVRDRQTATIRSSAKEANFLSYTMS